MPLIVHLIDFSHRNTWLENQMEFFSKMGIDQGLISISEVGEIHDALDSKGFDKVQHIDHRLSEFLRARALLKDWSDKEVIYLYAHGHLASVYALLFKLVTGINFVICHHHTPEFFLQLKKRMYFKAIFHIILSRLYYRGARKIQSLSPEVTQSLLKQGISADKIVEIPLGMLFDKFYKMDKVLRRSATNQETKHVVSVGRLVWNKRIDLGIATIRALIDNGIKVNYFIVGEGPELANLEKLTSQLGIQQYVFFLGWHEEINYILNTMDFFFNLSGTESYGQTIMEARLASLPIFSSPCGVALEMESLRDPLLRIFRTDKPHDIALEFAEFMNKPDDINTVDPRIIYRTHEFEVVLVKVAAMFFTLFGEANLPIS